MRTRGRRRAWPGGKPANRPGISTMSAPVGGTMRVRSDGAPLTCRVCALENVFSRECVL